MARQKGVAPTRRSSRVQQKEDARATAVTAPTPATIRAGATKKSGKAPKTGRKQSSGVSKAAPKPRAGNSGKKSRGTGRKGAQQPSKRGRPKKKQPAIEPESSEDPDSERDDHPRERANNGAGEGPDESSSDDLSDPPSHDEPVRPRRITKRFQLADIEAGGGLDCDHAKLSTLSNAVHPIWHFENFVFPLGSDKQQQYENYAAILPALRLASLWITDPQFAPFWISILDPSDDLPEDANAEDIRSSGPMQLTARPSESILMTEKERTEVLAEQWEAFEQLFVVTWVFRPLTIPPFAVTIDQQSNPIANGKVRIDERVATILHDDLLYLSRSPYNNPTTSEHLRLQFLFAVILCRELVQNIYWSKWYDHTNTDAIEPSADSSMDYQFDIHNIVPHDIAWERFMFSGVIHQISPPDSPMAPNGLAVQLIPWIHPDVDDTDDVTFAVLSMDWINDQFSSSAWEAGLAHGAHKFVPDLHAWEPAVVGGRDPFLPGIGREDDSEEDSEEVSPRVRRRCHY